MEFILEPEKKIPVSMKVDVIVAGGGVAGRAAAIASARNGANTVLIERHNALGGLGSMGMVSVWYFPYNSYKGLGRKWLINYGRWRLFQFYQEE